MDLGTTIAIFSIAPCVVGCLTWAAKRNPLCIMLPFIGNALMIALVFYTSSIGATFTDPMAFIPWGCAFLSFLIPSTPRVEYRRRYR